MAPSRFSEAPNIGRPINSDSNSEGEARVSEYSNNNAGPQAPGLGTIASKPSAESPQIL